LSQLLVAHRYAKALLQIGIKDNSLQDLHSDLGSVIGLVESNHDLERLCLHPLIPPSRKAAVFDEILRIAGAGETIRRFFVVVSKAARLDLIYRLGDAFSDLFEDHMGIVRAEVTSAQPLTEGQWKALSESFSKRTGKKMHFTHQHDPGLLGGLKVQVGSTVYDASLKGRLDMLRGRLLSA
jgi:F-type H+-transporting ATPase subunit delta